MSDEGNFYTLNNGMKIDKQLFSQKYAALNSNQTMDAESFLNQRPSIQVNPKRTNNNQPITEDVVINSDGSGIDPIDFLNPIKTVSNLQSIDNIRKIDTSKYLDTPESQRVIVRDLSTQDNAVTNMQTKIVDPDKQALLEKYKNFKGAQGNFVDENDERAVNNLIKGMEQPKPTQKLNENGLTAAQEKVRQDQITLIGEDPYVDKIRKYRASKGLSIEPARNPKPIEQVITEQPKETIEENATQPTQIIEQQDPTIAIFKKFKRNHKVSIKLSINDVISKPDFIKVMADGFEGDIIQFYTDELFKKFLENFKGIKTEIYNQLYKEVYGCLPGSKDESEDVMVLIPGKPTKAGKKTFKYINDKGKIVNMTPESAQTKGYKPAKN